MIIEKRQVMKFTKRFFSQEEIKWCKDFMVDPIQMREILIVKEDLQTRVY